MWRDLRFTLRNIVRCPSYAIVVAITLALGIGGSTSIFSVFKAVLLRDLPYHNPDQLYLLNTVTSDGSPTGGISLFLVAIFACIIPALQATRIQPAELLRNE